MSHKYDLTNRLIDYECGHLDSKQTLRLFKELLRTGMCWELQGHYGRTASALIEAELLTPRGEYTDIAMTQFNL